MRLQKILMLALVSGILVVSGCDLFVDSDTDYSFYITEVSTSGSVGGLSVDYIELYNPNEEDIDLTGYYFGDSEDLSDCYEVSSSLTINEWDSVEETWTVGSSSTETISIPAEGYRIILYSNDFAVTDEISLTNLVSWIDDDEVQSVDDQFSGIEYLTVPAGLKDSKAEGVYIYDADGNQATEFFTYEADEQGEDTVFLYEDGEWTQGTASPGSSGE